jgi:hypothetical protein
LGGVFVSERKRISGLCSLISILKEQTAAGLERPLQFQEMIFMRAWGTDQCPLTWWRKELKNNLLSLSGCSEKMVGGVRGSVFVGMACVSAR